MLATLNFEASSLEETGCPIEVACVIDDEVGVQMQFSTLIRPRTAWRAEKHWCTRSAAVHGIALESLALAMEADRVCDVLGMLLAGQLVVVDGGSFDAFWLDRLFDGRALPFALDHLDGIAPAAFQAAKHA